VFVRHEASKLRPDSDAITEPQCRRHDPFTELVRRVAADPLNPYNIERYLWVLEEPPLRACATCGAFFDPWFAYDGEPSHGPPRRYCSPRCRGRAAYERQRARDGRRCEAPYWQLDGSSRPCRVCGSLFDPAVTYAGTPTRYGRRRSFCSPECQARWTGVEQRGEWRGSAA
jgi:hypothetical protein